MFDEIDSDGDGKITMDEGMIAYEAAEHFDRFCYLYPISCWLPVGC